MVDMARFFLDFTQKESCGKCIHCRIGTQRMLEILERITRGEGKPGDVELLQDLGRQIQAGSLCGLGASAPNPALSTIRYFANEYRAHINAPDIAVGRCCKIILSRRSAAAAHFVRVNVRWALSAANCAKFLLLIWISALNAATAPPAVVLTRWKCFNGRAVKEVYIINV